MNKKIWIIIFAVAIGAYLVGLRQDSSFNKTHISSISTPSLVLKQQCIEDSNMLMNRLYQEQTTTVQQVKIEGNNTLSGTNSLSFSTYSNKLNTCLAIVEYDGTTNGERFFSERIYDTISGKLLAQEDKSKSDTDVNNATFIPGKYRSVSSLDYLNYKISIGL